MFGRVFISGFLSWLRLMSIVRREAAAGVSAALLHLADAYCAAGVAVPPVLPAGKEARNFALDRDKQLAGIRQRAEIIQLPPATPALADRTWVLLTGAPEGRMGPGRAREHERRTRQRRRLPSLQVPAGSAGIQAVAVLRCCTPCLGFVPALHWREPR
jgi:hypothetical protein